MRNSRESERDQLIKEVRRTTWEDEDDDDEPLINTNSQDFSRQQIHNIENQNKSLEALSASISKQKQLSSRLGREIGVHNEIIDNIAENIDNVDLRVSSEIKNVSEINRNDTTFCYWITIILLFITICLVATVI